jgi:GDP-D-mannose dehydratase
MLIVCKQASVAKMAPTFASSFWKRDTKCTVSFGPPPRDSSLNAVRDWGHAKDYMYGAHLILQQPKGGDYVLASGQAYSGGNLWKPLSGSSESKSSESSLFRT